MRGWIILLIILAVLFLLSLLRLGGIVRYGPEGLTVKLIAGPLRIGVLPPKPKKKPRKPRKEKPPKGKKARHKKPSGEEKPPEEKAGTVGRLMKLLPTVAEAAGTLKRKISIDRLSLSVVWGGEDTAAVALGYGRANALLGMIWPLLDNNFKVKNCDFRVDLDYGKTRPELTLDAALTMTVGQLLAFGIYYGVKLLMNWSRSGKRSGTQQEA